MANVNYDTLTIEINADSGKASRSITKLSNSLLKLEDVAKNLDWKQLEIAKKYLEDIAKISFDNVSNGLQNVVSAFKTMNKEAEKGVKGISAKSQAKAIDLMTNGGKGFAEPKIDFPTFDLSKIAQQTINFVDFKEKVQEVGELNNSLSMTEARLRGIGFSAEQIENMMKMGQVNRDLQEKIALLQSVGLTAQQAKEALKSVQGAGDDDKGGKGDKDGNKSMGKLGKLMNAFKRILFYRIVRRIIQVIAKAIREGIQNLAKFSSEFNETMSKLKSSFTYLKDAVTVAIEPIITALQPILTTIVDFIANIGNKLSELFSAISGRDYFYKATKSAEDYANALNNVSLGIDELNVVQNNGGNFEKEQVSPEMIAFAETFKKIIAEIKKIWEAIKPVIATIFNIVKSLVMKLLPLIQPLLEPIRRIIEMIAYLLNTLLENTNESVERSLISFTEMVAKILSFIAEIVYYAMPLLVSFINVISSILNVINDILDYAFTIVGGLFEMLKQFAPLIRIILTPLGAVLQIVSTIFYALDGIIKTMKAIITWDFSSIPAIWSDIGNQIAKGWEQWADSVNATEQYSSSSYSYTTPSSSGFTQPNTSSGSSNSGGNTYVSVYLDGEEITSYVNQSNQNKGTNTLRGGTLSYVK